MTALYKRDVATDEFVREARRFLSAIRCGHDEETAARRARTTVADVRTWMREPAFAEAYRAALTGKPRSRLVSPSEYLEPEELTEALWAYVHQRADTDRLGIVNYDGRTA